MCFAVCFVIVVLVVMGGGCLLGLVIGSKLFNNPTETEISVDKHSHTHDDSLVTQMASTANAGNWITNDGLNSINVYAQCAVVYDSTNINSVSIQNFTATVQGGIPVVKWSPMQFTVNPKSSYSELTSITLRVRRSTNEDAYDFICEEFYNLDTQGADFDNGTAYTFTRNGNVFTCPQTYGKSYDVQPTSREYITFAVDISDANIFSVTYYKDGNNFYTRTSRTVPGQTIWKCSVCGNTGAGLQCFHDIENPCTSCINGAAKCTACGGAGSTPNSCSACNGTGQCYHWVCDDGCEFLGGGCPCCDMTAGECDEWVYGTCPECNGTGGGSSWCSTCSGTGKQKCSTCNGAGTKGMWHCEDGCVFEGGLCPCCDMNAGECDEWIVDTCPTCNGTKYKPCSVCGGDGIDGYTRKNCATINVGTSAAVNYYTYTNIDTGSISGETTTSYTVATTYYVKFNINNANAAVTSGTTGGSMANQLMIHGHSAALRTNAFTFSGHKFHGWATTAGSSANPATRVYTNGQSINLTTSNVASGGTYNLYAVWLYEVAKPTASAGTSYTYNDGATITHGVSGYNTNYMTRGGTPSAQVVGNYSVTFTPKPGYSWTTSSSVPDTSVVSLSWSITKKALTKPTLNANPTFTGSAVEPTLNNFDSGKMTKGGTTSAINVKTDGNYAMTITLNDTANYQWTGGGSVTIYWNVLPQDISSGTISIPQTDYTYDGNEHKPTPTVTTP